VDTRKAHWTDVLVVALALIESAAAATPPYPPSPVIDTINRLELKGEQV